MRARNLAHNAAVSAAHLRGEEIAVVVHGTAAAIDVYTDEPPPFRAYLMDVYPDWEQWHSGGGARYWRIEPSRMFAARLPGVD